MPRLLHDTPPTSVYVRSASGHDMTLKRLYSGEAGRAATSHRKGLPLKGAGKSARQLIRQHRSEGNVVATEVINPGIYRRIPIAICRG